MRSIKHELDVDTIGSQEPISEKDKNAIREYFAKKKVHPTLQRNRRTKTLRKSLLTKQS
jgi:hypothetical protein